LLLWRHLLLWWRLLRWILRWRLITASAILLIATPWWVLRRRWRRLLLLLLLLRWRRRLLLIAAATILLIAAPRRILRGLLSSAPLLWLLAFTRENGAIHARLTSLGDDRAVHDLRRRMWSVLLSLTLPAIAIRLRGQRPGDGRAFNFILGNADNVSSHWPGVHESIV
jgi:hypothetical protein